MVLHERHSVAFGPEQVLQLGSQAVQMPESLKRPRRVQAEAVMHCPLFKTLSSAQLRQFDDPGPEQLSHETWHAAQWVSLAR